MVVGLFVAGTVILALTFMGPHPLAVLPVIVLRTCSGIVHLDALWRARLGHRSKFPDYFGTPHRPATRHAPAVVGFRSNPAFSVVPKVTGEDHGISSELAEIWSNNRWSIGQGTTDRLINELMDIHKQRVRYCEGATNEHVFGTKEAS